MRQSNGNEPVAVHGRPRSVYHIKNCRQGWVTIRAGLSAMVIVRLADDWWHRYYDDSTVEGAVDKLASPIGFRTIGDRVVRVRDSSQHLSVYDEQIAGLECVVPHQRGRIVKDGPALLDAAQ